MNVSIRKFNDYVKVYLEDDANLIRRLFIKLNPAEMYVQEQSASYLDLALPSPIHIHWKRYITNVVNRRLPHLCREFFIAETVMRRQASVRYGRLVVYFKAVLSTFKDRLDQFTEAIVLAYETKIFHKISERDSDSKYRIIREYLRFYRIVGVDRFDVNFPYLLDLCMHPPLGCELTVDLLRTFCDSDHRKLSVLQIVEGPRMLVDLILLAKDARFDFWGLWKGSASTFDYVAHWLARDFDPERLKILLKYGFPYSSNSIEYRKRFYDIRRTVINGRTIIQSFQVFNREREPHRQTRMLLIMDIFLIFANEEASYKIPILKYLFRSQALHYVTPNELHDTMHQAVIPNYRRKLEDIVAKYSESNDFDDDIQTTTPRLLMHLCRVVVRKILADNFLLLDTIQKLPIPERVKTYLELES